uniref:3'-5' exonuclease n=1 Tax=uncultured Parasutterella sp. TaxID=1263098 RepID=UPI0025EC5160
VGDDWQSINRFAGSDISIMREFSKYFGEHEQLLLTRTFRCCSSICDVSSKFVKQNSDQIDKEVKPAFSSKGKKVKVLQIDNSEDILRAVKNELAKLDSLAPLTQKKRSVAILGRYRKDCSKLSSGESGLGCIVASLYPHLEISYSTIHSAKGMEYDHAIVPRIEKGNKGFPCEIQDNPILDLAMPCKESFPFAEERRLLYVALTRARESATLIAPLSNPSTFVRELVNSKLGYKVEVEKLTSLEEMVPE